MTPLLRTKRLLLRRLRLQDVPTLRQWRNDESCRRYQCWPQTSGPALRRFVLRYHFGRLFSMQREQHYAVILKEETLVGDITVFFNRGDCVSIGYTIFPPFQRKGYAFELLSALLPELQRAYRLDIFAIVHPENIASSSLLKRLGFSVFQEKPAEIVWIFPFTAEKVCIS